MKPLTFLVAAATITFPQMASAQCLKEAGDFAERICGQVKQDGKSKLLTAKGDLNADAKGIIAKFLGQLGGSFGVEVQTTEFEGVIQQQLRDELVDVRKCGSQMATLAINQICTKAPSWKVCSHPSFGIDHWENSERLQGTTGWRGGGYNPGAYCTDFINSVVRSRNLGDKPHNISGVAPGEENRRTGMFNEHAEYNYHCAITLSWNPVYKQKADPICGRE